MLNLDSRSRSKLVWVATLLSPVVAVQGVRFLTGASPASASAATSSAASPDTPAVPVAEGAKPLTRAQAEALEWLASRPGIGVRRSPMDRPDQAPAVDADPPPSEDPTVPPEVPAPTDGAPRDLILTGIIDGGPEAALCAINNRIKRLGEQVWPGWTIARIDGRRRLVVLAGPDGRTALLSPPTPSAERLDE